jgi:ribonuclease P protein component
MLAALHRFHGYGSLRGVYRRGQTVRGPMLSLRFTQRDSRRPYRVAIVVSRKVSKSAVVRNRIRRRIYELVREQAVLIPSGIDLVFTVFDERVAELPSPKLEKAVSNLLKKAAVQDPSSQNHL